MQTPLLWHSKTADIEKNSKGIRFMKKIIDFNTAKQRFQTESELRPAYPTREEIECFRMAADSYEKASFGNPLPYWMYDGRELKQIWEDFIVPYSEDEGLDPWDVAGVLFASTHGMDFIYEKGVPIKVVYKPEEET